MNAIVDADLPTMTLRRRMPIAWVEFKAAPAEADFDVYFRFLDEVLALRTSHVTIVKFAAGSQRMSAAQMSRSSHWVTDNTPAIKEHCLGLAMVFENAALRFVLSTFLLMTRMPTAYAVCSTEQEALDCAASRLGLSSVVRPA